MFAKPSSNMYAKAGGKAKERPSLRDNDAVEEVDAGIIGKISLDDWTLAGRGSHVEFTHNEQVPLSQGQFLGRGAMGDVFETTVQGHRIAHKRIYIRRKISDKEKKEIEILKKLSAHEHMIQLVGSYTHRQFLGLLFYPVAVCDLHVLFEDIESCNNANISLPDEAASRSKVTPDSLRRLKALGYFSTLGNAKRAAPIYHKIGCLISAVEYLHSQQIRHKDLKPSNILLSKDHLWLSDFGSATDFSLLSQSATDNERGTPRYFSPEVAAWKPNGRSADMFSLGCVLLEIVVLHERGSLEHLRRNRSSDTSFHANLNQLETWCMQPRSAVSFRRHNLVQEIKLLLSLDPDVRPNATELLTRVAAYDTAQLTMGRFSIFGDCCKHKLVSPKQSSTGGEDTIRDLRAELKQSKKAMEDEIAHYKSEMSERQNERLKLLRELSDLKERNKHLTESNAKLKKNNTTLTENNAKLKQKNVIFVKKNERLEEELEQRRNLSVDDNLAATAPDEPKEPKQKPSFDKELIVKRVMEKLHEKLQQHQDSDITSSENNDVSEDETTSSSMTLLPLSERE